MFVSKEKELREQAKEERENETILYVELKNGKYMISSSKDMSDIIEFVNENVVNNYYIGSIEVYIKDNYGSNIKIIEV